MKQLLLWFLLGSWSSNALIAQTPTPPVAAVRPPPPQGPLIAKRAPEFARWTVEYRYKGEKKKPNQEEAQFDAADPQQGFLQFLPRIIGRTIIKTGKVIRIVTNYDRGQVEDRWITDEVPVVKTPARKEIVAGANSYDNTDLDFSAGDFHGFGWITPETFVGAKEIYGKQCFVYQKEGNKYGMEKFPWYEQMMAARSDGMKVTDMYKEQVTATAIVDAETRLPVMLQFGDEARIFQFAQAPTQAQQLPQEFTAVRQHVSDVLKPFMPAFSPP